MPHKQAPLTMSGDLWIFLSVIIPGFLVVIWLTPNHMLSEFMQNLFLMLSAHAIADYALQSDTMIRRKDPNENIFDEHGPWWWHMSAHAMINGGLIAYITHVWWLGALEAIAHWLIDTAKCFGVINVNTDQVLHLLCKAILSLILVRHVLY